MKNQVRDGSGGKLRYIPQQEFDRLLNLNAAPADIVRPFSDLCRINILYMIARAGSGHIGTCFSSIELMSWIFLDRMKASKGEPEGVFFSSKGHDAPALYAVLQALGRLPFESINSLRQLGGLPGHPDVATPGIATNTGSLGMGISKAKGMVLADRLAGRRQSVHVMLGDGELQEGQVWESLATAVHQGMEEITAIIDHNKFQSDFAVARTNDLGDLEAKFAAFGWAVARVDGHDPASIAAGFKRLDRTSATPRALIADTVKGNGVSFMEHTALPESGERYLYHSGAPSPEDYAAALDEITDRLARDYGALGFDAPALKTRDRPTISVRDSLERLVPAYGAALRAVMERDPRIVALDADLALDTGLLDIRTEMPERFFECGIAEMDMVSQAGGMALGGLLPVCHSFSCFLSTRANEQICNNVTEGTKIGYVGMLAGLLPARPGHSHQAVRDISSIGAMPDMVVVEPSCTAEIASLVPYCLQELTESYYMRIASVPWPIEFQLPAGYTPRLGAGAVVKPGEDAVIVAYGPIMLGIACQAAARAEEKIGGSIGVVNMPWLNRVDEAWWRDCLAGKRHLFVIDNHYTIGGLADRLARSLAIGAAREMGFTAFGLSRVPECGADDEVLSAHGLDAGTIAERITGMLRAGS